MGKNSDSKIRIHQGHLFTQVCKSIKFDIKGMKEAEESLHTLKEA